MPSALLGLPRPWRRGRPLRRTGVAALVIALAAGLLSLAPAASADTPADPAGNQQPAIIGPDEAAAAAAQAKARETGQPVVIDALTSEFEQTSVQPDGSYSTSASVQPTRAKIAGGWVPVDATLHPNADGSLSPKAAITPVRLSHGGTGPLAAVTNAAGKTLSLSVPFTLPAPTMSGDSALYANVLPDVDLKVTATVRGSVKHVVIVKSAAAAANPALKTLDLATTGVGINIAADSAGNLTATDTASGAKEFTASAPQMWDSSTTASAPATAKSSTAAAQQDTESGTPAEVSTSDGPGPGAQSATMPTTADGDSVTITPVPGVLGGPGTHYPVYIDPEWIAFSGINPEWTWIQSAHAGIHNTGSSPALGLCGTYSGGGSCSPHDTERPYYQFNNLGAIANSTIHYATLTFSQTKSASWSCTDTYPVSLYATGPIADYTWANHNSGDTPFGLTDQVGGTGNSGCTGNVPFGYVITAHVQKYVNNGALAFGLHGDESNANGFKHLTYNPVLYIQYDKAPNPPTVKTPIPTPRTASNNTTQPCETATAPTNRAFLGTHDGQSVQLPVTVTSPVGQSVRAYFTVWEDATPGNTHVGEGYTGYVDSNIAKPNTVTFTVPATAFKDGHSYAWGASTSDGILASAASTICHFRIDKTLPTVTVPTSDQQVDDPGDTFPPSGNGQTTTMHVGDSGKIPFTAVDPAPAEGVGSGLACMRWSLDPAFADATWHCGSALPTGTVQVRPTHWGTNIAYLEAQDNAGNTQSTSYPFYVPWVPTPLAYGDVTTDGRADVLAPDPTTGALLNYSQGLTFNSTPTLQAATAAQAPDATTWKNFRITHRGTTAAGTPVDDLFVHQDGNPTKPDSDPTKTGGTKLYYYPNNSTDFGKFNAASLQLPRPDCVGDTTQCPGLTAGSTWAPGATWAYANQITPIGSASTTLTPDLKTTDATGILTVEAGNLWFYPKTSSGAYDANGKHSPFGAPTLVAKGGWDNYDLMIPGDALATGKPALWARARTTAGGHTAGDILQYALTTAAATDDSGTAYTTVTGVTASPATAIGGGITTTAFPLIGSDGDLNGDGIPDLWASSGNGKIVTWDGVSSDGTAKSAVKYFTGRSNQWFLNGTPNDASGGNNAAPVGTVTWAANHAATTPGAAAFTGTSALVSAFGAVDTAGSYTISAWVKLNTLTGDQYFVAQGGTTRQAFDLGYRPDTKTWTFMTPTGDTMANTAPSADAAPGAATTGTWTHLTGVYDATTHSSTLYVNGHYAGAATNPTPWHSPGHLTIGAIQLTSSATLYNPANATISDTRIYPYAFTTEQAANLYSTS
ncbi:LamG domain-containing protein [Streptomyces sp. SID13666]|uniref:LamG domain-containing protein n=1 Tax=unclassified Streptomyces TaxID=2593676 RepID=UPI0013C0BD57|nr:MULTISPECIES: LamG domain-containing protein [unclassified Streptomyces]NEA55823.1 LamG domain-containing protein [Streptomyces sp. SID13666]NEA71289.1 LamG domain-containing protein [Streptomyces sp. SID13588]